MSPAKFNGDGLEDKMLINGSRPCPLRINKDSHAVQKPSFPYSRSPSAAKEQNNTAEHHQKQQRGPVIIYAHSPKVIHTKPRDFLALVQKLTGLSPPAEEDAGEGAQQEKNETRPFKVEGNGNIDPSSTSSSSFSPPVPSQLFSDTSLFTPNSSSFFFLSSASL